MSAPRFIAYRGLDQNIQNLPIVPELGYLYFATDTGKIYMDYKNQRLTMGNTGASLLYADAPTPQVDEFGKYLLGFEALEDPNIEPKVDDLILNSDGSFYRVEEIYSASKEMLCIRVTVSGTGTGSDTGVTSRASIRIGSTPNTNLINGQAFDIPLTGKAEYQEGEPVDTDIFINYEIYVADNNGLPVGAPYGKGVIPAISEQEVIFKAGPLLRPSTTSVFKFWVSSNNALSNSNVLVRPVVYCDSLELKKSSEFSNLSVFAPLGITVKCLAIGKMGKILKYTWDDEVLYTEKIDATNTATEFKYTIPTAKATHGRHILRIDLYQRNLDDSEGQAVEPLIYEIAVEEPGRTEAIIWLGDYKQVYKNYDNIKIPFLVFVPGLTEATINFYKRGIDLEIPRTVSCTAQNTKYNYFEITDADHDMENFYSIVYGVGANKEERQIRFSTEKDDRDMTLDQASQLVVNFSAKGRSNNEAASRRASWEQTLNDRTFKASFTDFNWRNNGWVMDPDNDNETCLRISNGASFKIPIGAITMAAGTNPSAAFEMQFKIRNVQDYSNLIQNVTRYQNDELFYTYGFITQTSYTNYDAFLNDFLRVYPLDGVKDINGDYVYDNDGQQVFYPVDVNGDRITYDSLKFSHIQKNVDLTKTICRYVSTSGDAITGFALGTQDCFFSNGANKVTAPYIENEMVNLAIVYSHGTSADDPKLMTIYVNGIMTGVINSTITSSNGFTINANEIEFTSKYCDIDLFKFRVYRDFLNVKNVVKNFAVDRIDVDVFDQNNLAELDNTINEYRLNFNSMISYNETRKKNNEEPLMPYIIFDTSKTNNGDRLSWSKSTDLSIGVTFKNTGLDYAYETGALERMLVEEGYITSEDLLPEQRQAKVKKYYQHHCPSWTGEYINMAVQGTSSEFYPRRNYKLKTKTDYDPSSTEDLVNIHLNEGPFAEDFKRDRESTRQKFFYMNNEEVGTTKFTMKIDYMESSGTYNMGFANLVYNAYAKHPLAYYDEAGAFQKSVANYQPASSYVEGTKYFVEESENKYSEDKTVNAETFNPAIHFVENISYTDCTLNKPGAYRTSVQGFPVLAFHKKSDGSYHYIGRYNMLLDKGSDECFGFKPSKDIVSKFITKNGVPQQVRKTTECWEFSNNSRTYCSFRDPQNRYKLSFKVDHTYDPNEEIKLDGTGNVITEAEFAVSGDLNSARSCPIVADSFEYRYNDNGDALDYIYDPVKESKKIVEATEAFGMPNDLTKRSEFLYSTYKNWEKAVQWVWSTNVAYVGSEGKYVIPSPAVGAVEYVKDKYYVMREVTNDEGEVSYKYVKSAGTFDAAETYYELVEEENGQELNRYRKVYVSTNVYTSGKYYIEAENSTPEEPAYRLSYDPTFDSTKTYYILEKLDLDSMSDEKLLENKIWRLPSEVSYPEGTFKYDTKEYRQAKFINELEKHFNKDYLATYFIMTEVFECYDSRGKNCMMASWGPMEEGGDYIWFPIFYDIDTQLGINNTGIPSFEYSIDATAEGTFSTSDSILWNNFYQYFKADVIQKYKQLKGENSSYDTISGKLSNPPLASVENIRKWYKGDPEVSNNIAMRGQRPLIALNLDEYYKYLTIMNKTPIGLQTGKTGYIDGGGKYITDNGTYLYALQGDRDLYITQFVTNRIDYIDSWLNVGNYQRGGANNIWGRMAANNKEKISDWWVEGPDKPYFDAEGNKSNEFDAEYWVTVSPIRKTYVTIQDDNGAYPSIKYNGSPLKTYYTALERGVRNSLNYPEQLVYIYGINSMGDIGDISKMYWQEFKIVGEAKKLRKLLYGYDGLMTDKDGNVKLFNKSEVPEDARIAYGDDSTKVACRWYNNKVNPPSMPSGKTDSGMPLLQEVNFSNIQINSPSPSLDLTSCEKLQNFRATGSNFTSINFADGVALHTLYLPDSLTSLKLIEAKLLDKIITRYAYPTKDPVYKNLIATPGLYISGFTDCGKDTNKPYTSSIETIHMEGDNFGYGSYNLMLKLKEKQESNPGASAFLTLKEVKWSPYELLTEGDIYDNVNYDYYIDNNHYGVANYTFVDQASFELNVLNKKVYRVKKGAKMDTIKDINIFKYFIGGTSIFKSAINSSKKTPDITGIVYIDNTDAVEESYIRNFLIKEFPNLTFIFKNVVQGYSAKFLVPELVYNEEQEEYVESGVYSYAQPKSGTEPSTQSIKASEIDTTWFANPYDLYEVNKTNFVFEGWGIYNANTEKSTIIPRDEWDNFKETAHFDKENIKYYEFHAVFSIHKYKITYHNVKYNFSTQQNENEVLYVPYGNFIETPTVIPATNESLLMDEMRYKFVGYSANSKHYIFDNETEAKKNLVNPETIIADSDRDFYAMYIPEDATKFASPEEYFKFTNGSINDKNLQGYFIQPAPGKILSGKITIPSSHNEKPVIAMVGSWSSKYLTHLYFMDTGKNMTNISGLADCSNLKIVDFPSGCYKIEQEALARCPKLIFTEKFNSMPLEFVGNNAFIGSFDLDNRQADNLLIPASLLTLESRGYGNMNRPNYMSSFFNNLQFGDIVNPVNLNMLSTAGQACLLQNIPTSEAFKTIYNVITFYVPSGTDYLSTISSFLQKAFDLSNKPTTDAGYGTFYGGITIIEV